MGRLCFFGVFFVSSSKFQARLTQKVLTQKEGLRVGKLLLEQKGLKFFVSPVFDATSADPF